MKPFYTPRNYAVRNSVGYLMRICTNRLLPQMELLFDDQALTFTQWTTLVALHDGRITTAGDLAHNICHDAGSLTRLIDQMEKRGLVARGRSDTDRRLVTLALTPPGRALVEALAPKVMDFWNGLLAGFTHAEIETLIVLLTRLVTATEAKTGKKLFISDTPIIKAPISRTKAKKRHEKTRAILSALLLSATLLAGCVATPPTTPQVAEVKAENLGLTGAPAPHFPLEWWKAFHDPQVDKLVPLVIANNPSLAAALARMRAAQAELSVNQAQDLPQVTLDGSEQRTLFSNRYIIPPPYGGSWRWFGALTTNLNWNLDFWGKQAALIAQAGATADAAALDAQASRLALSGAFAQTYVNLLLNYQNGEVADQSVAERTEILKITQGRFDAGLENGSTVAQAKTLLAQARADQLRFAAAREMDVHAIAALAGQGAEHYADITRPNPQLDTALPLPETLPADLLSRRPDILASRARIAAAMKGREAAHADFYPDINLAAMAGFQSIGLSSLLTGSALTLGIGPAIHLPIFDAGKLRAQYAGATAQLDEAVADYNGSVTSAIRQTADAMTQVKSLAAQTAQQREAVADAQKAYRIAQDRYRSGLDTQLPTLTTETTLLQTRAALAAVVAAGIQQRITLLLTVGGGFEPDAPAAAVASAKNTVQIAKDISHD